MVRLSNWQLRLAALSGRADITDVLLGWQLCSQQVGRGKAQSGFSAAGKKRKT